MYKVAKKSIGKFEATTELHEDKVSISLKSMELFTVLFGHFTPTSLP